MLCDLYRKITVQKQIFPAGTDSRIIREVRKQYAHCHEFKAVFVLHGVYILLHIQNMFLSREPRPAYSRINANQTRVSVYYFKVMSGAESSTVKPELISWTLRAPREWYRELTRYSSCVSPGLVLLAAVSYLYRTWLRTPYDHTFKSCKIQQ